MDLTYTIREYHSNDFAEYVQLWLSEGHDQTGHYISPQILKERVEKPSFTPEETVLVAEHDKNVIGCLNIDPELAIKHAFIECIVHHKYRKCGVATSLFEKASQRMLDLGVTLVRVPILESNRAAISLLLKLGFKPIRRFIRLQQIVERESLMKTDSSLTIRHLLQGEESTLTNLLNSTFSDHWGYSPNTTEEVIHYLNQHDTSYQHVILAFDDNKPVGYCWTTNVPEANPETAKKHGRILMLGVDADYRNRGIGRSVLVAGISFLFSRGVEVIEITADSLNERALALYQSVGFEQQAIEYCYEKALV